MTQNGKQKLIKDEPNMRNTPDIAAMDEARTTVVDGNASTEHVAQWETKGVSSASLLAPVTPLHLHKEPTTHVYSDTQMKQISKKGSNNAQ